MPKGKPNKRYTPEFKIKVVETMHREKLIKYVCLTFRTSLPAILRKTDDKADKIAEKQSPLSHNAQKALFYIWPKQLSRTFSDKFKQVPEIQCLSLSDRQ